MYVVDSGGWVGVAVWFGGCPLPSWCEDGGGWWRDTARCHPATSVPHHRCPLSPTSAGKLKERRYDAARGMSLLVEDWVSAASAKQRRGRAGRVRPGVCYGLYSRARFERRMRRYQARLWAGLDGS